MAHRRSFRGRGISESQRRKKVWFAVKDATGTGTASNSAFLTSISLVTPAMGASVGSTGTILAGLIEDLVTGVGDEKSTLPEECTILRARGSLVFPKNEVDAGGLVTSQYAFGFGVSDIRSISKGEAPAPIVDVDWDGWMFLRQSGVGPVDSEGTIVDVKAMRKIKTGDALFFSAQAVSGDSTISPAGQFLFDMRLLILLP